MVKNGQAATREEAGQIIGKQGLDAARQKLVKNGQAATYEEASVDIGMNIGVASALKAGKRVGYPGVTRRGKKWRVRFQYQGDRIHLGMFEMRKNPGNHLLSVKISPDAKCRKIRICLLADLSEIPEVIAWICQKHPDVRCGEIRAITS